VTNKLLA
jgi:hypothetical protein